MDKATLKAQSRQMDEKTSHLRSSSLIPAQYYGKGVDNINLKMDYQDFRRLYRTAGENTVIELEIDGKDKKKVLVHRVDYHPVRDEITYVELINVRMDEEVTANVPVVLVGTAPAVKELGGTLIHSLDEVEVRCLPGDLIHEIVLNVEPIVDFHSALHVSDLVVPAKVQIVTPMELTIVSAQAPREDEPEEAPVVEGEVPLVGKEKKDSAE